jgi:hypothetical protein
MVGLLKRNSGSSSDSAAIPTYSVLSTPIINCVDNGPSTCGCSTTKPSLLLSRIVQDYTALANSWS